MIEKSISHAVKDGRIGRIYPGYTCLGFELVETLPAGKTRKVYMKIFPDGKIALPAEGKSDTVTPERALQWIKFFGSYNK